MQPRYHSYWIPILAGLLLFGGFFFFWPAAGADAQCGSQASSCKNCHEVQGQDPVNTDGTAWHQSHAFGDFCYLCHGGNNQSMDPDEAHAGMVPPLADVQAACQSCHPADLMEKAGVYAAALGVEIGGADPGSGSGSPATPTGEDAAPIPNAPAPSGGSALLLGDGGGEIIDFNRRYEETVLGKRFINWGNVVLSLMIGMVAVGGGAFIFANERKLRGMPAIPRRAAKPVTPGAPRIAGYSDEVSALLPLIAQLDPAGLHALRRLLENPAQASALLQAVSKLDPALVRQIRSLDRDSRALLLALAGE